MGERVHVVSVDCRWEFGAENRGIRPPVVADKVSQVTVERGNKPTLTTAVFPVVPGTADNVAPCQVKCLVFVKSETTCRMRAAYFMLTL